MLEKACEQRADYQEHLRIGGYQLHVRSFYRLGFDACHALLSEEISRLRRDKAELSIYLADKYTAIIAENEARTKKLVEALEFYAGLNWNDPVQLGNCRNFHGVSSEIDFSDHEKMEDGSIMGGLKARQALRDLRGEATGEGEK